MSSLKMRFQRQLPLSSAQNRRLARAGVGILLAGDARLPKIARQLPSPVAQVGRVRLLQRLWAAPFVTQERVDQPLVRQMSGGFRDATWHLVMERRDILLTLLSGAYLWATGVGRWLCKGGNRREVDARRSRISHPSGGAWCQVK
jgi:hypothetical protein